MGSSDKIAPVDAQGLRQLRRYVELGGRPLSPWESYVWEAIDNANAPQKMYRKLAFAALKGNRFAHWWLSAYPPRIGYRSITESIDASLSGGFVWLVVTCGMVYLLAAIPGTLNEAGVMKDLPVVLSVLPGIGAGYLASYVGLASGEEFYPWTTFRIRRLLAKCRKAPDRAECLASLLALLAEMEAKATKAPPATSNVHGAARLATESEIGRLARGGM